MVDTAPTDIQHNAANDMRLTALIAGGWDTLARPLSEHIFIPLEEWNHNIALAALNLSLTAPRGVEPLIGKWYENSLAKGNRLQAALALGASAFLAASDGIDGSAARQSGLTSEIGAAGDPAVDLFGSFSISRQVKRLAIARGDSFTARLMDVRRAVDGFAVAAGGVGNGLATKFAESQGVELEKREQAKANAASKLKYGLGTAGTVAIRASYVLPEKYAKPVKRVGQGMVIGAIAVGLKGGYQYAASATDKVSRGVAARQAAAA